MKRKPEVIDPINLCTHCPHPVIDIGRSMFCPCEDCHYGGLVQGREPKDNHTTARVSMTFRSVSDGEGKSQPWAQPSDAKADWAEPTTIETEPAANDGEVWVDPVHRVG